MSKQRKQSRPAAAVAPPEGKVALRRGIPASTSRAGASLFTSGVVLLLVLSIGAPFIVQRTILLRQRRLPENAVWEAVRVLDGGGDRNARRTIDEVLNTKILDQLAGTDFFYLRAFYRNSLAPNYHQLSEALFSREGWAKEGEAVAYKAILDYHQVKRPLEYLDPWRALQDEYLKRNDRRFLTVMKIIGSHSREKNHAFYRGLDPALLGYAELRESYYNMKPERFARELLRKSRLESDNPDVQIALDAMRARNALELGNRARAREIAQELAGKFDKRLDAKNIIGSLRRGQSMVDFLAGQARTNPNFTLVNFMAMEPVETEYHGLQASYQRRAAGFQMRGKMAAAMPLKVDRPVKMVYLLAEGTGLLDVYPIAFVTVDGGEIFPLYVDREESTLYPLDLQIEPGEHTIRFEYINDFAQVINGELADRNLRLNRLLLVHE